LCIRSVSDEDKKTFDDVGGSKLQPGVDVVQLDRGSCHAVRSAVSTLYNFEDFEMVKIGEGFFSEVFKVKEKKSGTVFTKLHFLRNLRIGPIS
jgi:hypothetical protein